MSYQSSYLLSKTDLEKDIHIPRWLSIQYKTWNKIVEDFNFPCYFGVAAQKSGHLFFSYIENDDFTHLPSTLISFLEVTEKTPSERNALVLFVQPEKVERETAYYHDYFWKILNFLHEHDKYDWPEDFPLDPDDPKWEFIFHKTPIFISANGPFYKNRITRNLGDCLILIFQPRRIFADLSSTPKGKKATQIIRANVEKIEGMPTHPDLGSYGDPNNREWKQYVITDDNNTTKGSCPFHHEKFIVKNN